MVLTLFEEADLLSSFSNRYIAKQVDEAKAADVELLPMDWTPFAFDSRQTGCDVLLISWQ